MATTADKDETALIGLLADRQDATEAEAERLVTEAMRRWRRGRESH